MVLAVSLALGIKHAGPVLGLEVGLGVDIDLDLNVGSLLLDGEGGDTDGVEKGSEELADSTGAPSTDNIASLEAELSAEDGVRDGAGLDLAEGKRLVDGGALVAQGVDGTVGVNSDADGKATGNSGGGTSRGGELAHREGRDIRKLGGELAGLERGSGAGVELCTMIGGTRRQM